MIAANYRKSHGVSKASVEQSVEQLILTVKLDVSRSDLNGLDYIVRKYDAVCKTARACFYNDNVLKELDPIVFIIVNGAEISRADRK